jgi:hypothetical protein
VLTSCAAANFVTVLNSEVKLTGQ